MLHQARRFPFEIGEIHRARLALVRLIAIDQCVAQSEQCSVDGAHVGFLAAGLNRRQRFAERGVQGHQRLCVLVADGFDERLGRLAGACLAGLRMEGGEERIKCLRARGLVRHIRSARSSHRRLDGHGALALGRTTLPKPAGHAQHVGQKHRILQRFDQRIDRRIIAKQCVQCIQRTPAGLRLVRPPVAALVEHCIEQATGLEIADQIGKRFIRGAQISMIFGQQAAPERRPSFTPQPPGIFTQRRALLHARRQRRPAQQRPKPAVERIDRHARWRFQHARIQPTRGFNQRRRIALIHRARDQLAHDALIVGIGQLREDVEQTLTHLFGGLARKRDGENVRRRGARKQQAQHASDQQPGLAAARARFHHDRALRIACGARKGLGRDGCAVAFVSVIAHAAPSGSRGVPSVQYPLRHRPRAAQ